MLQIVKASQMASESGAGAHSFAAENTLSVLSVIAKASQMARETFPILKHGDAAGHGDAARHSSSAAPHTPRHRRRESGEAARSLQSHPSPTTTIQAPAMMLVEFPIASFFPLSLPWSRRGSRPVSVMCYPRSSS